nr:hypothetical protein HK105_004515 [Polyrhizophydium stewartii]
MMLRALGSTLPVEVVHCGGDDLGDDNRAMLADLPGVSVLDMLSVVTFTFCESSWSNKPIAALVSSFREVILIDADTLFFQKPERLFDMPEYVATGTLLFRDRTLPFGKFGFWGHDIRMLVEEISGPFVDDLIFKENRIFSKVGSEEIDSGVVVWNKARAMPAILFTCLLNIPPFKASARTRILGDKETFWLAHEATRIPFGVGPGYGSSIGSITKTPENKTCVQGALFHADAQGRPLWFNGGIGARQPAKELNIRKPLYWALDDSAQNIEWDLSRSPFCLVASYNGSDPATGRRIPRIGRLTPDEESLANKMVALWVKLFQL